MPFDLCRVSFDKKDNAQKIFDGELDIKTQSMYLRNFFSQFLTLTVTYSQK